jgi:hypothetical protein
MKEKELSLSYKRTITHKRQMSNEREKNKKKLTIRDKHKLYLAELEKSTVQQKFLERFNP